MNRPIRKVVMVLLGCFVLLFVQLNRIQFYGATALEDQPANSRTIQRDFDRPRGRILTSDDVVVAESTPTPGGFFEEQRAYPHNNLYAHTVGYTSFTFGAEGVEREYNDALIGRTAGQELSGLTDILSGRNPVGDVRLTLRHDMQTLARDGLGDRAGAVVALNPVNGDIYAMWSFPSFDPNLIAVNDGSVANEQWTALVNAEGNPLRAKTYRDIFFPGSTFKLVTAAAALENDVLSPTDPEFEAVESYVPPLTERPITNFGGATCGGNLIELLVVSCNTAFAQVAAEQLGPGPTVEAAERFGFNQVPPIDLPASVESIFPTDFGSAVENPDGFPAGVFENTPALAQTAIGQNDVSASPLQMALVAAAVANGGQVPTPHVLQQIEDSETRDVTSTYQPSVWLRAMAPDTAAQLTDAMIQVVERGTAQNMAIDGLIVGAKTGTAQLGTDPPRSHAWIVAFGGRASEPAELAVAVLVEGQEGSSEQTGGRVAAPIARSLFEQFFSSQ